MRPELSALLRWPNRIGPLLATELGNISSYHYAVSAELVVA